MYIFGKFTINNAVFLLVVKTNINNYLCEVDFIIKVKILYLLVFNSILQTWTTVEGGKVNKLYKHIYKKK